MKGKGKGDKEKPNKDFKKDYISSPYKNIPILKVIYHDITKKHNYKLIFVGQQTVSTKKLINKYISGTKLTEKEHIDLDTKIKYYHKKMNVDFNENTTNIAVYYHLETNISIKIFQLLIYHLIKKQKIFGEKEDINANDFVSDNQLIYIYNINIGYKKIVSMLNFIFKNKTELSNEDFIRKLIEIFSFNNKKELKQEFKLFSPNKS